MSWYSLFKFAQSGYGSWISPSGEVFSVDDQEHYFVGKDILKDRHNIDKVHDIYGKLFDLGYIRLVHEDSFAMEFGEVTNSQKSKIGPIIGRSRCTSYVFESVNDHSKDKYCGNKIEALRVLREL